MKIDKSNSSLPPPSKAETTARAATPKAENTPSSPNGVSVNLGTTSNQLRSMEVNIASTPMVDAKKVAEIKQAISDGRFQINSGVIADSLISNVEDMINSSQS